MELHKLGNAIANITTNLVVSGGIGYLSTWAFTSMNPVVGLAYGVAYTVAGWGVNPVFATKESNFVSCLIGTAMKTAIAANITMAALGVGLSMKAACALTASVIAGNLIVVNAILLATAGCAIAYSKLAYKSY